MNTLTLTCTGTETFALFNLKFDIMPDFGLYRIFDSPETWKEFIEQMANPLAELALKNGYGFVEDTMTWRASKDWVKDPEALNRKAVLTMLKRREEFLAARPELDGTKYQIVPDIGPRSDAYAKGGVSAAAEAALEMENYHFEQLSTFAALRREAGEAVLPFATAMTIPSVAEGLGIVRAARRAGLPVLVSFTCEPDFTLPADGAAVPAAFDALLQDDAAAAVSAADAAALVGVGLNCVHPAHVVGHLTCARAAGAAWTERFAYLRVNGSEMTHGELDNAHELDRGDPARTAAMVREIAGMFPSLQYLGGCCGTDLEHAEKLVEKLKN